MRLNEYACHKKKNWEVVIEDVLYKKQSENLDKILKYTCERVHLVVTVVKTATLRSCSPKDILLKILQQCYMRTPVKRTFCNKGVR